MDARPTGRCRDCSAPGRGRFVLNGGDVVELCAAHLQAERLAGERVRALGPLLKFFGVFAEAVIVGSDGTLAELADEAACLEWERAEKESMLEDHELVLGIAYDDRADVWFVWQSLYGSDVNVLSGWETRRDARDACDRYRRGFSECGAAGLIEALRADRSGQTAGYVREHRRPEEETRRIRAVLSSTLARRSRVH